MLTSSGILTSAQGQQCSLPVPIDFVTTFFLSIAMQSHIRAISRKALEIDSVNGKDLSWDEFINSPSLNQRNQDFLMKMLTIESHIFVVDLDECLSIILDRLFVKQLQIDEEIKRIFLKESKSRKVTQ